MQDNRIEFDDLGRMRVVEDMHSHVEFYYDANGNRLEVRSNYRTAASGYIGVEGDLVENDVFNTYDKANRQLFVNAVKVNGALEIGKYGHKLSYDSAGQRISDTYRRKAEDATTVVTDNYRYDNAGRMITTTRDGDIIDFRQYDIGGRLIRSGIINGPLEPGFFNVVIYKGHLSSWDLASNYRTFHYDAAGRILRQKERDFDGKQLNDIKYVNDGFRTTPMGYDNAGRLRGYFLIPAHSELVEQYNYSITYSFMDSAQQSSITVKRDNTVRTTTNAYDQNGNLIRVTAPRMDTEVEINRVYVNDASGHVLRMTAGSEVTSSLVVNDQLFASYGGAGADAEHGIFANTFSSATDVLANGTSQSVYVVQSANETLQTIAKMVWGDSSLWYLIADANGLSTETLTVGMPLQIPTRVSAVRNDYASFKPYDRSSIDGNITPSLPAPPGYGGCGPVGTIVTIVVAALLNAFAPGLGVVVIGALSSAVGQLAAIEAGEQKNFSWKAVALSAVSAGVTEGFGGGLTPTGNAIADKAITAAVANAMTQGIGIAFHLQEHFQWRGVAAAAASAGANELVNESLANTAFAKDFGMAGMKGATSLGGGVAAAIARGGKIRFGGALADAFGNALGASIAESMLRDELTPAQTRQAQIAAASFHQFMANEDAKIQRLTEYRLGEYGFASPSEGAGEGTSGNGSGRAPDPAIDPTYSPSENAQRSNEHQRNSGPATYSINPYPVPMIAPPPVELMPYIEPARIQGGGMETAVVEGKLGSRVRDWSTSDRVIWERVQARMTPYEKWKYDSDNAPWREYEHPTFDPEGRQTGTETVRERQRIPMPYMMSVTRAARATVKGFIGAAEMTGAGLYNGVIVRPLSGFYSLPFTLSSVDSAVQAQRNFSEAFSYRLRSDGARAAGQLIAPLAKSIDRDFVQPATNYSESNIGVGATYILKGTAQAGFEIWGTVGGVRSIGSLVEGAARPKMYFGAQGANTQTIATAQSGRLAELLPESTLSTRQAAIHAQLSEQGSFSTFSKRQVSMADLRDIGRVTGDEYNMFTKGGERLIIRGEGSNIRVSEQMYDDLLNGQYGKFSGHTHPPGYSIEPGPADRPFLNQMQQGRSAIWGDNGYQIFGPVGPADDARILSEINRARMQKLYGN